MKKIIMALGVIGGFMCSGAFASAAYFNNTPIEQCNVQITSNLSAGSENDEVFALQNLLNQGGYMYVSPNGYFGPSTKAALKRFQIDNAIFPTGMVGSATRNALNERLCDGDVRGENMSYGQYNYYGSYTSTTYVDNFDPYVRVVSPASVNPSLYNNPPTTVATVANVAQFSNPLSTNYGSVNITPTQNNIFSTNVIYSPYVGYTYGIIPQSGVLTIKTPLANSVYNEGDTVILAWNTSNLNANQYQILLENTSSNQSKVVAVSSANNASFVLTREILDLVCSGACDNNNTGSFRIVVTTPVTDIAGIASTFRAAVSPITIKRPFYGVAQVSISSSKTPISSGETFKLYVNVPNPNYNSNNYYTQYSFKIRAICVNNVQVSIAGTPCGQDFLMPTSSNYFQQEIPSVITNSSWYRQDVIYEINAFDINGKIVGTARTTITVNPSPFNW